MAIAPLAVISGLEHGRRRRFVRLLAGDILLHPLDLRLECQDARLKFTDRKIGQRFAERDALGWFRVQLIPIHGGLRSAMGREPGMSWPLSQARAPATLFRNRNLSGAEAWPALRIR